MGPVYDTHRVISLGQDVQICNALGDPIYKPETGSTKESIYEDMVFVLGEENKVFYVKSGNALFSKDMAKTCSHWRWFTRED